MKGKETYARRKVLAGFVMTRGTDTKSAQVIFLINILIIYFITNDALRSFFKNYLL